jgi:hypothetical protein
VDLAFAGSRGRYNSLCIHTAPCLCFGRNTHIRCRVEYVRQGSAHGVGGIVSVCVCVRARACLCNRVFLPISLSLSLSRARSLSLSLFSPLASDPRPPSSRFAAQQEALPRRVMFFIFCFRHLGRAEKKGKHGYSPEQGAATGRAGQGSASHAASSIKRSEARESEGE